MEYIALGQDKYALIDDEDFELVSRFKWHINTNGYADTVVYLGVLGGKRKEAHMQLHRLLMRPRKDMEVDHRNHERLDCRRSNLRICTHAQNQHNQVIGKRGSSGFKGVCWHKVAAKWMAYITHNGKLIYLGLFTNETEAAKTYDVKAKELFGDFANTNF